MISQHDLQQQHHQQQQGTTFALTGEKSSNQLILPKTKGHDSKPSSRRNSETREQPLTKRRTTIDSSNKSSSRRNSLSNDQPPTTSKRKSSRDHTSTLNDHKLEMDRKLSFSRHNADQAKRTSSSGMRKSASLSNISQIGSTLDLSSLKNKSSYEVEEQMKHLELKNSQNEFRKSGSYENLHNKDLKHDNKRYGNTSDFSSSKKSSQNELRRSGSYGNLRNKDLEQVTFGDNNRYGKAQGSSKLYGSAGCLYNNSSHGHATTTKLRSSESINEKDLKKAFQKELRENKRKLNQESGQQPSTSTKDLKHDESNKRPKRFSCLPKLGNTASIVSIFTKKHRNVERKPVNNTSVRNNPTKAYRPKPPYATYD